MSPPPRVVLVGFMAAGKSTVGPLLARRLGYRFVDLDAEVERRAGRSIPEIFRQGGERAFRQLEAEVTGGLDEEPGLVVAAGGGWMVRPELRDRWPDAVRVWLEVRPETVLRRLGDRVEGRPMLDPADPGRSIRRILRARERVYALAELTVSTDDRSPEDVAAEIARRLEAGAEGRP